MNVYCDVPRKRITNSVKVLAGLALAMMPLAQIAGAQTQATDDKPAQALSGREIYQTLYLTDLTQQNDMNDIVTDLRNVLPKAKIYLMSSQKSISIRAAPEDIQLAQKLLADLDRAKKVYRLTYTITDSDSGKRIGARRVAVIVISGGKTQVKQGSKVPIVTGTYESGTPGQNSQVQYQDIGLNIEATVDGFPDGVEVRTKIEQSSVAEEKSGMGPQDPVVRQTVLEETSTMAPGKPLLLGSLDVPGSTRHQEIEVVAELVR
jgi:type II secretory pathway component GspD/PulD (secretin)